MEGRPPQRRNAISIRPVLAEGLDRGVDELFVDRHHRSRQIEAPEFVDDDPGGHIFRIESVTRPSIRGLVNGHEAAVEDFRRLAIRMTRDDRQSCTNLSRRAHLDHNYVIRYDIDATDRVTPADICSGQKLCTAGGRRVTPTSHARPLPR